jgi:hypothetical protein
MEAGDDLDVLAAGSSNLLASTAPTQQLAAQLQALLLQPPAALISGMSQLAAQSGQALMEQVDRAESALLAGDLAGLAQDGREGAGKLPDPWVQVREMQRRHVQMHIEVRHGGAGEGVRERRGAEARGRGAGASAPLARLHVQTCCIPHAG